MMSLHTTPNRVHNVFLSVLCDRQYFLKANSLIIVTTVAQGFPELKYHTLETPKITLRTYIRALLPGAAQTGRPAW